MTIQPRQHHPDTDRPSVAAAPVETDPWGISRLDLDAYLRRVGYTGKPAPDTDTLVALHRAHALSIPFENLGVILGHGVSLDIDDLQHKLVRRRRGGYCFEHNLLFAAVLERVGFTVRRHLGRVLSADPHIHQPRTHVMLNVDVEGGTWHADVGFGTTLIEPIPLTDGEVSQQGAWTHGVAQRSPGSWVLRSLGPEGWSDRYAYTRDHLYPVDFVAASHYTATHPDSHFTRAPVAARVTPEVRYRLNGLELTTAMPDGSDERHDLTPDDLEGTLRETFGIELRPDEITTLRTFVSG